LIGGTDLLLILPEVVLAVLGIVILGVDLFYLRRKKDDGAARSNWLGYFTLVALLIVSLTSWLWGPRSLLQGFKPLEQTFASIISRLQEGGGVFGGVFYVDGITQFFRVIFLLVAALVLLLSLDRKWGEHEGEYYALLVFAVLGMTLMAGAAELVTIYIALELTSISLYILAAMDLRRRSIEAGLKYFLFGAFSSALLLYGLSLLYGFAGTTHLDGIATAVALASGGTLEGILQPANSGLLLGIVFLVAGFGFKLALVPFHSWTPDVYEGAPTPITAFISTGSKAASFVVFLRVMLLALPGAAGHPGTGDMGGWGGLLAVLAVVTFTVANLMALSQKNVKRLLAYSSIAHAGYMLIGVLLNSREGTQALFYYLAAYVLTNVGAFATVIAVSRAVGGEEIKDFAGLSKRNLPLAGALSVLFLSLGGLPPLAGFFAKFWLFWATWQEGLIWLVVVALLNTLISFFYYLRVLKAVWFEQPADDKPVVISDAVSVTLIATTGLIILIGVLPQLALQFLEGAVSVLFPPF
jgi:proton-translocating NADH-quinone oxidoreductase chain N